MRARGLTRRFGALVAVDRVDLDVPRASVTGFLGPNGSGKTTTLRMLCGLLTPSAGEIEVLGLSIPREAEALKRRIGYMTQKFSLYEDLSVIENLRFIAAVQGLAPRAARTRIDEVLALHRLADRRSQLAGTMSGGQKQRLALACCVLHAPELLLLDEPTSAVDPESRREFWDHLFALADTGTTLLVSTHFMDEAERCHRLAILDRGRLVAEGTPAGLTAGIEQRVLAIDCARPREAQALLRDWPGVGAIAQIGTTLRVLAARELDAEALRARLSNAGIEARVAEVPPNLEDVFVAATRRMRAPVAA
ncbi:MAG TPA: ABC transporter ATP-binding protein [Candidatus Saccharimonadia bacterium]|nr:ABC transporter ATP-binding protein [Candidatus Saccharimonadia bacterium]